MSTILKNIKKQSNLVKMHRSHLDERLSYIKSLALSMGSCVEKTIADAKDIVINNASSQEKLSVINKREEEINYLQVKLSKACFRSLARQAPVAKDLRLILTVLNANTDLERMGDLAANIAKKAKKMDTHSSLNHSYSLLDKMFCETIEMVRLSLNAFVKEDSPMARKVLEMDDRVDQLQKQIFQDLENIMKSEVSLIPTGIRLITVSGGIERIADHATNIAEEIIFLTTGRDIRHKGSTS